MLEDLFDENESEIMDTENVDPETDEIGGDDETTELSPNPDDMLINGQGEWSHDDNFEDEVLADLKEKAEGIERAENGKDISFGSKKICATRHGCSGATSCNYNYADYPD